MGFIVLAVFIGLETWALMRLGSRFGAPVMLAWMLGTGFLGGWVVKRQGLLTLREIQHAAARGEVPALALLEGLIVIIAGLLLVLPGVIGDAIGLALWLAGSRSGLARRMADGIARARPDLKQPVVLEGEFREPPTRRLPGDRP
ncbi:MAG TPA: FxsA family protein [Nevskiaceae bacterium]|nr:FxsA family protein [Nevskiaceae bacterium]